MNKRIVITMDIFDSMTQKDLLGKVSDIQQAVVGLFEQVNITIMAGEVSSGDLGEVSSGDLGEVPSGAECDCPTCTARRAESESHDSIDTDTVARRAAYLTIKESEPALIEAIKKFRDDAIGFDRLMALIDQAVPEYSPGSLPQKDVVFSQHMVRLAAEYIFLNEDGD